LEHLADRPAGVLSSGDQRRLDIARALAQAPQYLLLDEPSAGMTGPETRDLLRLLMEVTQGGVTVVLAEHDATLALDVCDRVAVLNAGKVLVEGPAREVGGNGDVQRAYLGSEEA
ncbi:MAG TPA: ATP-binding cassette domain-containing protein, partial [Chloroflexota bacterium]